MSKKKSKKKSKKQSKSAKQPVRAAKASSDSPSASSFVMPIVGICSSAGGLHALTRFIQAVPEGSGAAYVVVPHLDPTHKSMMVELLGKHTQMPVVEVEDGVTVQPDCVYIIPPNRSLAVKGGKLHLAALPEPRHKNTGIDGFLRSLAGDQHARAIAIVLSGTGSNGSLGIKDIKLSGGMVMAQDPESAEYDAMPRNAIATGMVDYILKPEDMPDALISYIRHPYLRDESDFGDFHREQEKLGRILGTLRTRNGRDFRGYRKNMLLRRIQRRMGLTQVHDLEEYHQRLRDDRDEFKALSRDLLIGVTAFFREHEAFHILEQRVIPKILEGATEDTPVRVWVPACATGEEAYSIGMLLIEAFERAKRTPNIQIFATDLDEEALAVARRGVYPASIEADISPERLRRFFLGGSDDGYRVTKQLRDMVVIAQQSLISDAPFSHLDLVSCRNLLIYFEPELQTQVIRLLHFALNDGGFMMLGPSESISRQSSLFEPVSKKWRVYQKTGPARPDLVDIPISGPGVVHSSVAPASSEVRSRPATTSARRFSELANRVLLDDSPAAVLINESFETLNFHGPTVNFLEFPSGVPSTDLLAMLRQGLRTRVRSAVLSSQESGGRVVDDEARVKREGHYISCRITVKPVREHDLPDGLFMVIFEDGTSFSGSDSGSAVEPVSKAPADESQVVQQLEGELKATREDLQTTIEELEGSNEELKASNEEIMSMNEELQSANEELETSKEELQSMNEELNTVNTELQSKVQDLESVNNDITNLLSSTNIATLFLDLDMCIKRFTPPTGRLLSLIDTDHGRPITDFSARVANESLIEDARIVLDQLTPIEKEVWSEEPDARCYLRRIVPYKSGVQRIEGVVLTFVDITMAKQGEAILEQRVVERTKEAVSAQSRIESIIKSSVEAIVMIGEEGHIEMYNPAAELMFGYSTDEVMGQNVKMLMPEPYNSEHDAYLDAYRRTGEAKIIGIGREVRGQRKDGSTFPLDLSVAKVDNDDSSRFVGTMRDLTAIQQAQEELAREHALSEGIVSTARAIILRLDQEGRIMSFNPYMEELTGYSLDEVRGKDWFTTFIPERELERIKYLFSGAIKGRRTQGNINAILTRDGHEVLVEWYDDVLRIEGEPTSLIAIGHDVTARERLEREFLQAQKMEAVGRLAGGVAHDFNNLLAGIIGGLRIASNELDEDGPARKMLDQVKEEAERGSGITRRLLDFSRVGKSRPGLIDPRETLEAGERMIRRLLGEDIEVCLHSDGTHSQIYGDAGQVEQAVLNLAINARDAMPRGGKLSIRCFDDDLSAEDVERLGGTLKPGSHVVITVEDTGCGMDAETQAQALEAFFTTKGAGLGTGLGLSSVATMMDQCGGALELISEVGVGTTVRLIFPKTSIKAVVEKEEAGACEEAPRTNGGRILLVEDETLVRLGAEHTLNQMGYTVESAKDSDEALQHLENSDCGFDLLLTDVVLPGMSGPELAVIANEKCPNLGVLYMSAFPGSELIAQKRIAEGTMTLEKPFSDDELSSMVEAVMARKGSPHPS